MVFKNLKSMKRFSNLNVKLTEVIVIRHDKSNGVKVSILYLMIPLYLKE
jgi:hypothetical protein